MSSLRAEDLEVVGFNGTPQVECSRSLPVVRRRSDGMYGVLNWRGPDTALIWHDEAEAAEFARARRWTRLREPLVLSGRCVSEAGDLVRQPMIVHVADSFLATAGGLSRPVGHDGESLTWRSLEGYDGSVQTTCASANTVESLMNGWATRLKARFDTIYARSQDRALLKPIADFMLCAAVDRPLRWQAYLRYALTQEADRVHPTFETFTRPEFPNASWDAFVGELASVSAVLAAAQAGTARSSSSCATVQPKLRRIAARQAIIVVQVHEVAA